MDGETEHDQNTLNGLTYRVNEIGSELQQPAILILCFS